MFKKICATVAVMGLGVAGVMAQGLDIITKNATTGVPEFHPDAMANPIIDAVIDTAKWGALVALVFIGLYIIIRMFKGK